MYLSYYKNFDQQFVIKRNGCPLNERLLTKSLVFALRNISFKSFKCHRSEAQSLLTKEIFYSRLFAIMANTPSFLNEIGLSVVFWSNSRIHVLLSKNLNDSCGSVQLNFPRFLSERT